MNTQPVFTGRSGYLSDASMGPHRLLVAVPCRIADAMTPVFALLDTASEWCVLPGDLAEELETDWEASPRIRLHSRFGLIPGALVRTSLSFPAEEGQETQVDATWFVSAEWPGPAVLGWKGALERIRFAIDPADETFYFAEL
ncbi:MAG: hypothetical protein ACO1SX_07990 [Actinomycetota bacterium]